MLYSAPKEESTTHQYHSRDIDKFDSQSNRTPESQRHPSSWGQKLNFAKSVMTSVIAGLALVLVILAAGGARYLYKEKYSKEKKMDKAY